MQIFKKLLQVINPEKPEKEETVTEPLSTDQIFVQKFLKNNGKFLYCETLGEVNYNLKKILQENNWKELICTDNDLQKILKNQQVSFITDLKRSVPLFVTCEHLISDNGSILFSSNQLKEFKISKLSPNFIVYATTSQLVNSLNEGLTGIKAKYQGNIPSNISTITNYNLNLMQDINSQLANTNAKNLYLLLFEDL